MNGIIKDFMGQGFLLTVRQLYYQLVARAVIQNTERSYQNVIALASNARLAGLIDWDAIEDRTRSFISRPRWKSGKEILQTVAQTFHMDMWENQPCRPFVIIEKEALVGVLTEVCRAHDVPILAARGYPSGTVLREFAKRVIIPAGSGADQKIVIIHLGDHDPSGLDMSRDLEERLRLFSEADAYGFEIIFQRVALNMPQIEQRQPPPNPAKVTDSRFAEYQREYGDESWELDALPPAYLVELVENEILDYREDKAWLSRETQIKRVRSKLKKVAKEFKA